MGGGSPGLGWGASCCGVCLAVVCGVLLRCMSCCGVWCCGGSCWGVSCRGVMLCCVMLCCMGDAI